jgi:ParB/RepB/Spo0J family partition protein
MTVALMNRELKRVSLDLVDPPNLDIRVSRDDDGIEELGRDIVRRGQIEPIHVFVKGDRYEGVNGWTRCIAMRRQSLTEIEAFVYPEKSLALEGLKYASNIFRLEMSAADEAKAFYELFHNECGEDIERVCALVGKGRGYVDARIRLVMGDDLIFAAVSDKKISLGVAERLNKIDKADWRRYYLTLAIRDGITVAGAERYLQDYRENHADRPAVESTPASTGGPQIQQTSDLHRCYCCGENDSRFVPELIPIHTHCKLAVLDKLLGRGAAGAGSAD